MIHSMDDVLDTLDNSVAEVHRHVLDQQFALDELISKHRDLRITLDRQPGNEWMTIAAAMIVAFIYGAWFGVVQCPK